MKKTLTLFIGISLFLAACSGDDTSDKTKTANESEHTLVDANDEEIEETSSEVDFTSTDTGEEVDIFSEEIKGFIEDFNNLASLEEDIGLINEVEPAKETEDGYSQTLFSSSEYVISALYDKEGNVDSYIVTIPESQPYQELKGNGLYAMLHVGAALGLDIEELVKEFGKALPNRAGLYFTDDYTITFSTNNDVPEVGIIVMFMNLSLSE